MIRSWDDFMDAIDQLPRWKQVQAYKIFLAEAFKQQLRDRLKRFSVV